VELREFSDVPVITISSSVTSSSVNLAEATVKRIAEMDFLLTSEKAPRPVGSPRWKSI